MRRTRSQSNEVSKQDSLTKKSRTNVAIDHSSLYAQSSGQSISQSIRQPMNDPIDRSMNHPSDSSACKLFSYNFLMWLIVSFLNDGDVMCRLLTLCKSIKQVLPKYTFQRMCDIPMAFQVIDSDSGIAVSVSRVEADYSRCHMLAHIVELNSEPLKEVHLKLDRQADIPRCVTHLTLGYSAAIQPGMIPDSVIELSNSEQSCWSLTVGSIPSSVRVAKMSMNLYRCRRELIPDTVTELELDLSGEGSREFLPGMFPSSLTKLSINYSQMHFSAGVIPSSVKELSCGWDLLASLEPGTIPSSVTKLTVWCSELGNDNIKQKVVPDSVTHIILSNGFVDLAAFSMPLHVTHLDVHSELATAFTAGLFPRTLTHISICVEIAPGAIPNSVTHLCMFGVTSKFDQGVIPPSITHLDVTYGWEDQQLEPGVIPSSVTHLVLNYFGQRELVKGFIPNSVTHLTLETSSNHPMQKGVIPDSVTHLILMTGFPLTTSILPRDLKHLCFGATFNNPIKSGALPPSLETLVFGERFNQEIRPGVIPDAVKYLAFGTGFKRELNESCLPAALTYLEIPRGYVKRDNECWLPPSLTYVSYREKTISERPDFAFAAWNK